MMASAPSLKALMRPRLILDVYLDQRTAAHVS